MCEEIGGKLIYFHASRSRQYVSVWEGGRGPPSEIIALDKWNLSSINDCYKEINCSVVKPLLSFALFLSPPRGHGSPLLYYYVIIQIKSVKISKATPLEYKVMEYSRQFLIVLFVF